MDALRVDSSANSVVEQWRELIPDTATVARQHYRLASVKCDMPLLMLPLHGVKQLHVSGDTFRCGVGDYLMVHGAVDVGVENIPAESHPYRAWIIGFPWRLIELTRQLVVGDVASSLSSTRSPITCQNISPRLAESLQQHLSLQRTQAPAAELDLSLMQILVALHGSGDGEFLRANDPSLAARIRVMVSMQPQREWTSADFEDALHLSGATLRRRLAEENTSLRQLIREARLHVALTLLQTTRCSIKTAAAQSGYRSLSSFREGFIEQFGVPPTTVAND